MAKASEQEPSYETYSPQDTASTTAVVEVAVAICLNSLVRVVDTVVRCAAVDVTLAVLETTLEVLTTLSGIFFRISSFAFHPSCKITFISFIIQPYVSLKLTKHRILLALFMMLTLRATLIFSQRVNLQITNEPILSDALV